MPEMEKETGDVAVLVVHGIGAQERGETLGKLLGGLRRVERDSVPKEIHDGVLATVGGQRVRFYEVYWADLLKGDIMLGAFQMKELQSLSWFPWLNFRRGNYRPGNYSALKLAWWCLALPIINFFVLLAYYGAGFVAELGGGAKRARNRFDKETESTMSVVLRKVAGQSSRYTKIDRILDEYAGDVFSYVNSAGRAFYREERELPVPPQIEHVYTRIMQQFYDQLVKAADGCATIQIVAHSLGTVVTYHALSGLRFEPDGRDDAEAIRAAVAKVRHLYTIGSPLEKIRFFWPKLTSGEAPPARMQLRWDNFVSWFDPVAGILRRFGDWGKVCNHRLLGGGFIRGHVVYERSPVFLSAFTRGLCGHEIPFERTPKERWQDLLVLIGETLFAPTVLAVVLILGAGVFALTVSLLPFLLSLPLRLFLPPETWGPIVDTGTLYIAGAAVITLLLAPLLRAIKVHALYWVATPPESGARH